jgi:hypothetical protein
MNSDFSGVWKADLQRSKLLGPQPKAILAKIKYSGQELVAEMLITKVDGREDHLLFRGRTSGEEVTNVVQGVAMRSRLQWVGTELLIESWVNLSGHRGHFLDYWSLSSDGQTLIMEHRGDDLAGQTTFLGKMG